MEAVKSALTVLGEHKAAVAGVVAAGTAAWVASKLYIPGRVVETEEHGGDLVARVLRAHGVPFLFTLTGGHISPILVSAKRAGIRVIDVRHEVTAVFAADAVARLTGVPGVAAVTAGPGITNTITAVKNAQMAESPVVLLGGAAATLVQGRGALQDIDQMSLLKPIVKFAARVESVREIVPTLRQAFQAAMSGVPGPVFVELPIDVLYPVNEVRANLRLVERLRVRDLKPEQHARLILPEGKATVADFLDRRRPEEPVFLRADPGAKRKASWIETTYLEYKVRDLFSGAFDRALTDAELGALPVAIPSPAARHVRSVAKLLASAKRPVLLISSQATLFVAKKGEDPHAPAERLRAAVEALGIPTYLGGMARGLLGVNSEVQVRQDRKTALREADVIILAGTLVDFRLDYGRSLSRSAKIVAINRSAEALKQNTDLFWTPWLASQSDPASFLLALAEAAATASPTPLNGRARFAEWTTKLKASEARKEEENRAKAREVALGRGTRADAPLLNPIQVCFDLEDALPDDSILIGDGGDFIATAAYTVRPRGPLRWLDPGPFGTLGVGGGFALGAKLCCPSSEVWLLWGDGSVGYSVAEYDTFKRHNVPVLALVGNDACWSQIEREQIPILGDNVACPLEYTPYDDVARGYGGDGATIAEPGEALPAAIRRAQGAAKRGVPFLVNALIGRTDFREGSISV